MHKSSKSKGKALIVIDMQNDFIDGSLANPAAQKIVEPIVNKVKNFEGDILFTRDLHSDNYLDTQEGEKLPIKHCVLGSHGYSIQPDIFDASFPRERKIEVYDLNKESFGFKYWTNYLGKYDEVEVCGTCTDICVVSNVLIIKAFFPELKITVLKDLCAGSTEEKHEAALEVMRSCQIDIK